MKLQDMAKMHNKWGRSGATLYSQQMGNKIRLHFRNHKNRTAVRSAFRVEISTEYDWFTDTVNVHFIDMTTGQRFFSSTDPEDPEQFAALIFAVELLGE